MSKTTNQKRIEGDTHSARHKEPLNIEGQPKKPTGLGKYGSALWDDTITTLAKNGIATTVDESMLQSLCFWWQQFKSRQESLAELEDITTTQASRAINFVSRCYDNYRRIAQQFGLTAESRNKITAAPAVDDVDDYLS